MEAETKVKLLTEQQENERKLHRQEVENLKQLHETQFKKQQESAEKNLTDIKYFHAQG